MSPNLLVLLRNLSNVLVALIIGALWHAEIPGIEILTLGLPMIWWRASSRTVASLVWIAYYLALAIDITPNYQTIYPASHWASPVAAWIAQAALLALPWIVLWSPNKSTRSSIMRGTLALLASALPPLGLFSWGHPLLASGTLYPGLGIAGIIMTGTLIVIMLRNRLSEWNLPVKLLAGALLLSPAAINYFFTPPSTPPGWLGADTSLGKPPEPDDRDGWRSRTKELTSGVSLLADDGWKVIVLPELVGGEWDYLTKARWIPLSSQLAEQQKTLLLGVTLRDQGRAFRDGVVVIDNGTATTYPNRIPMPIGLWRPWSNDSAIADWFGPGQIKIAGKKVALSVCFEDFSLFAIAWSMRTIDGQPPEIMVSIANNWFGANRGSRFIQERSINLGARLYGVPLVRAVEGGRIAHEN